MKAFVLLVTVSAIGYFTAYAQIPPAVDKKKLATQEQPIKVKPVIGNKTIQPVDTTKKPPVVQQPPATTNTNTNTNTTTTPTSYYLVACKVRVMTGNDNKELQSGASIRLMKNSYIPDGASPADFHAYPGERLLFETRDEPSAEFKVNSTIEKILKPIYSFTYQPVDIMLGYMETYGFKLIINYSPNFPLDAWRVNTVIVTLQVQDRKGNPHPYLGYKEIMFSPNKLMNANNKVMELYIDENFMRKL